MREFKRQLWIVFSVLFIFTAILIAAPSAKAEKITYVTIVNGASAGSGMPVVAKLAELINRHIPGVRASATPGTWLANCRSIQEKRHTIAMADGNTSYVASRGIHEDFKGREAKDIRLIAALHHGAYHIFAPKDHPLKSVREAATKYPCRNLMVTSPLAASYYWASKVFEAYGSSFADLEKRGGSLSYTSYERAISLMKDGQCDILMIDTPAPSAVIMDIDTNPGVRFLEMEPEIRQKLCKMLPGFVEYTIPGGAYKNMPNDYHTVCPYYVMFAHKDESEEFIYKITKLLWEHEKDFQRLGAQQKEIKRETALRGVAIPVHPGAARYYKEIGMDVPDIKMP